MLFDVDISKLDLQDALDLAALIEEEAEERYLTFVEQLGVRYPGDATDFFAMMARNERRHKEKLAERRHALFGDTPSQISADMIDEIEAPDMGKPRPFMSPRNALEVAMESEIKAYEFYDRALQLTQNTEVHELFEELRDEELWHQQLLNELKERYPDSLEPDLDADDIDTPSL